MAELVDVHNPSERQLAFRRQYQAQIHPLYSGPLHIGVIYVVGLSVIAWCVSRLQNATWEWLLVIPVFFLSNLFEWWIHKRVMHRLVDVWALRAIYDRHTRQHHQYFTDNEMTVSTTREWRIIFFPWRALFTFMPMGYSFNLDGSMMYCTFATLFIAQAYGIELSLGTQLTMLLILMLTSKGMAGVPRASLVVIAATLNQFNIPEAGLLLILGVDTFLDMGRSATNAVGNSIASAVVAKWEGELLPPTEADENERRIEAGAVVPA